MGAQHSTTRTVQLENDAPVGVVIDVSDDVVQRLKGLHAKGILFFPFDRIKKKKKYSKWKSNLTNCSSTNANYVTSFM